MTEKVYPRRGRSSCAEQSKNRSQSRATHDQIFKTTFRLFLSDLIELMSPEVAATLDLSRPKFIEQEALTDIPKGKRVSCDLVSEVATVAGEPKVILIHVETEGQFREVTDIRILRYSMHLRLKHNRSVISFCVYLTGGPGGVTVRQVIDRVGQFEVDRFSFIAFGLSKSLAEEYVDRPQPLAAALAALMRSEKWDKVEKKLRCLKAISHTDLDPAKLFVLANIVETYVQLNQEEHERFTIALSSPDNKEVREMEVTWEEALTSREKIGLSRGRAEGRAEGKAEGEAKATREAIVMALGRLGSVPEEMVNRLDAITDIARLKALLKQALEAESIESIDLN
jgi:hypothetical protein